MSTPSPPPRACSVCKATPARLQCCGRCKANDVRYCSAACQREDWPTHKRRCTPAGSDQATAPTTSTSLPGLPSCSPAELEALARSIPLPAECGFAVRVLPSRGGGLGLVATRDFVQGEQLLSEAPLLVVPHTAAAGRAAQLVAALSPAQRETFFTLHASRSAEAPEQQLEDAILRTNGMRVAGASTGVFALAARLNHSCAGNVHHIWRADASTSKDATAGRLLVLARKAIRAGEELCTHYVDCLATRDERRERLRREYGFDCDCPVCALSGEARARSDERRIAVQDLEQSIMSALLSRDYAECLRRVDARLGLLAELERSEGVLAPYTAARSCADALEAAQALQDDDAIHTWAERTRHFTHLAEGADADAEARNPTLKQCAEILGRVDVNAAE